MNLWDTHCHLYEEYYPSIKKEIQEASSVGVKHYIVSGTNIKNNNEVIQCISCFSNCFGVIGLHPEEADLYTKMDLRYLEEQLKHAPI